MYIPKHFAKKDKNEIAEFIHANAFGQLLSQHAGRLCAAHIPFALSGDHSHIYGHLARQNPQWQDIDNQEVLIILQGPHGYVSPTWYSGPGVPTWNYQALHIYGRCSVFEDTKRLRALVDDMSRRYEADIETPWVGDFKESLLSAIVGVDIEISDIQCKYKLSQNRSLQDRQQVIAALRHKGRTALAKVMQMEVDRDG